jgi:hypothetical protein
MFYKLLAGSSMDSQSVMSVVGGAAGAGGGGGSVMGDTVSGSMRKKIQLAEVTVVREKDFGVNDTQFTCISHLGNLLREGDVVLGYVLILCCTLLILY